MTSGFTFYADQPARRVRQIVADALIPVWIVAWTWVGQRIYGQAVKGDSAQRMETAGGDFSKSMGEAGSRLGKVPVIGEDIQQPFDRASTAGSSIAQAGRDIQLGVDLLGQVLGTMVACLPIFLVIGFWAQMRWRYAQRVRLARAVETYTGPHAPAVQAFAHLSGLTPAALGLNPTADLDDPPPPTGPTQAVSAPLPTVQQPESGPITWTDPPAQG